MRGDVTSPTFVISRVHPPLGDGPALVHVDAYRLGGIDELDDLDLDTSLDDAVTVVEWGEGIAEGLAESRLEIRIIRALAHEDEHADLDPRRVLMTPVGPRWYEMEVPSTHRPPLAEKREREPPPRLPAVPRERARRPRPVRPAARCRWWSPSTTAGCCWCTTLAAGVGAAARATLGDGESARAAAERVVPRRDRQRPRRPVDFVGVATVQLGHERPIEYAAMFRSPPGCRWPDFAANEEVDKLAWWDVVSDYDGLSPIDEHLARMVLEADQPER